MSKMEGLAHQAESSTINVPTQMRGNQSWTRFRECTSKGWQCGKDFYSLAPIISYPVIHLDARVEPICHLEPIRRKSHSQFQTQNPDHPSSKDTNGGDGRSGSRPLHLYHHAIPKAGFCFILFCFFLFPRSWCRVWCGGNRNQSWC